MVLRGVSVRIRHGWSRQKRPSLRQHRLKQLPGPARARVVATQLLKQFLVAAHDPMALFHSGFGREPFTALAGGLERTAVLRFGASWRTSRGIPLGRGTAIICGYEKTFKGPGERFVARFREGQRWLCYHDVVAWLKAA